MDPNFISDAIVAAVTALTTSATTDLTGLAKAAVTDAYGGLKTLIKNKYGSDAPVSAAVAKFEEVPDSPSLKDKLITALSTADAANDDDIAAAAAKVMEALKSTKQGRSVIQKVTGNGNAVAANSSTASVNITYNR